MFTIQAKNRDSKSSISFIRSNGEIPVVVYASGQASQSLVVSQKEFYKIYKEAGTISPITLMVDGKAINTLIHAVQFDPLKNLPAHADFLIVDMKKVVHVSVPLEFVGVAPAVKSGLGILVKVMHEVEIEALPNNIPQVISVDIGALDTLQSQISAEQLVLPKDVTLMTKPTEIVVSIAEQKEEAAEAAPIDLSQIEVAKKGKKEEQPEA
jgi:large subunit ribosomal protein L25